MQTTWPDLQALAVAPRIQLPEPMRPGRDECHHKTAYPSRYGAHRGAVSVAMPNGDRCLSSYKCGTCHRWHLTSRTGRTF